MRLFDDTMKALALNAYEMNHVYGKMVKESVKQKNSLRNIEKSNDQIEKGIENMENMLSTLLDTLMKQ